MLPAVSVNVAMLPGCGGSFFARSTNFPIAVWDGKSTRKFRQQQLSAAALQLRLSAAGYIRRAQVKVGLINLCKGLFSLNARIYYKLKSGT
jgi:hypothetical protein